MNRLAVLVGVVKELAQTVICSSGVRGCPPNELEFRVGRNSEGLAVSRPPAPVPDFLGANTRALTTLGWLCGYWRRLEPFEASEHKSVQVRGSKRCRDDGGSVGRQPRHNQSHIDQADGKS